MRGVDLALRLILGGIFLYSGAAKLFDPSAFQSDVANFELVSWKLSALVAVYLPWLEILCGAALVAKVQLGGSLLVLRLLMVGFIVLVASAWARGLDVTCGCFGASDSVPNYPLWIVRNIAILGGLFVVPWVAERQQSPHLKGEARKAAQGTTPHTLECNAGQ